MRVALANAKGGVAKTTSCIYLAAVLARRGIEVAVYDADPQSSASLWAAAAEQAGDPLPFDVCVSANWRPQYGHYFSAA